MKLCVDRDWIVADSYMKIFEDTDLKSDRQFVTWICVYTENWTVADSWLHEGVYRERTKLWPTVTWKYSKTQIWNVTESLLHESVCRQRPELWPIFGSPILTVFAVTQRSVSSSLWRKVEQQSIAVLHTTLFSRQCHCSYSHYLCALLPTVHCSTIYTINTTHSCWTCH
jgi:hypothetical protein